MKYSAVASREAKAIKLEARPMNDMLACDKAGSLVDQLAQIKAKHGPCSYGAIMKVDCDPSGACCILNNAGTVLEND